MRDYEWSYKLVSDLWFLGITILSSYNLGYFLKPFLEKRKHAIAVAAVYLVVMVFLAYMPWEIGNIEAYMTGAALTFCVMWALEPRNGNQKLFLSITFLALRNLVLGMENCIDMIFFYYSEYIPDYNGNWELQFWLFVIECILDLILSMLFIFFAVWLIQKVYVYKREQMSGKELILLCVPSLSGVAGSGVLRYYNDIYERDTGKSAYDIYLACNWRCFLYFGITFAVILVTIALFQNIKERQNQKQQSEILDGQIADMKRHIVEVERLYRDMRSLRHDMGNHVMTLEGLCRQNENEEAVRYVAHLKQQLHEVTPKIKSGNPVTDVILTEKEKEAKEKGIHFECDFYYQEECGIDVFDISVILNNALANAFEAAGRVQDAFVRISSRRKKNAFLIIVENSYTGELIILEESGLPQTSKKQNSGHGFGLANIQRVAQKYYGDLSIEYDQTIFRLTVLLMTE